VSHSAKASLPSAMGTALGKAGKNCMKTPDFPALPSVMAKTLGKAGLFAECQATTLSKGEGFAECHYRHSAKRLFKKNNFFFAESQHSANNFGKKIYINSLPSVVHETLGKATVMIAPR